jgi:hypothetical protein
VTGNAAPKYPTKKWLSNNCENDGDPLKLAASYVPNPDLS